MNDNKWAMLCKLRVAPFDDPLWRWERKLDGCRLRVDIDGRSGIGLTARSGADKTAQFPDVVQALALTVDWGAAPMILDGEVVSADGLSFQEFNQRRMNRTEDVALTAVELPAAYVAFDVLSAWGRDMEPRSLADRLVVLGQVRPSWCKAPECSDSGVELFKRAVSEGWEGVVGKRLLEPYLPNRRAWVKVKLWHEGVFDCVGYTFGAGKREKLFGALVFQSEDGRLKSEVGTGFDDATLESLLGFMSGRRTSLMLVGGAMPAPVGVNVEPFKVRVKYCEVTNAGSLRFPVYLGKDDATRLPDTSRGTSRH